MTAGLYFSIGPALPSCVRGSERRYSKGRSPTDDVMYRSEIRNRKHYFQMPLSGGASPNFWSEIPKAFRMVGAIRTILIR